MTGKLPGKHKFFITMSFLAYVVMAIPYTVHGSLAPVTMELYGISAAQQGFLLTMQSVGALGAAMFIALKGERYNKIHTIAFGLIIIGVMGAIIGSAPAYAVLLIIVIIVGIGVTFIDIMMNGVMSDVYPERKNTLLSLVHGFYMLGAMLVPRMVTLIANPDEPWTFSRPFHVLLVAGLAVGALYLISGRRIMPETPYGDMEAMKVRVTENPAEIFKTKTAWFFIAVGLLYFTFQIGVMMWLPTYTIQNVGADFSTGGMALTVFFAGNLVMRFAGPLFLKLMSPRILYSVFGIIAGVLMVCALLADNIALMFILLAGAGFTQGASVPAFMILCINAFPDRTASAASITTLCVGFATFTAPLWMGVMSAYTDGFLVPLLIICGCLFIAAGLILIGGRTRKNEHKRDGSFYVR